MLRGLALWVWYWDDRYLDVARRIGAATLLVKAADGATAWEQWDAAAAKCREAGVEPVPWAYNYGEPGEVDPLVRAASRAGVSSIVVDPEIEYERLPEAAQRAFVEAIRAAKQEYQLAVGCACWARPEVHGPYRFALLAEVVDLWLPMVAWQVWQPRDWAHWLAHWDGFGHRPTAPWLPAYAVSSDELAASVRLALDRYGAATVWAAHELTEGDVAALEALRRQPQQPDPVAEFVKQVGATGSIADVLHLLWALAQGQRVGGDPGAATCIEAGVIRIKELVGIA